MATTTLSGPLTRRQRYQQTYDALLRERSSFEASWGDLAEMFAPRRIRKSVSDTNKGDRRTSGIYDSSPRFALRTLQHGLHAGITSPARPWFRLTLPDPDLAEQGEVKLWLHAVTQRLHDVFQRSNLYNSLPIVYGDLGCFGTAAMAMLEDPQDLVRTYCYPVMSYAFGLDSRGVATTFVREYRRTCRQLVQEFGGEGGSPLEAGKSPQWRNFSTAVKSAWDGHHYETAFEVIWFVCPNEDYNPRGFSARYAMPWKSCWFEKGQDYRALGDGEGFLRESGYRTFPFFCPRWDVVGEDTYGTDGPGWIALGDARQLQYEAKQKAKLIGKAINPPLKAPSSLRNQKVSLVEGDLTYVDERDAQKSLAPIHEVRLDGMQYLLQDTAETRFRVEQAFFANLFLMLANSNYLQQGGTPVTAREIEERHEEKLLALGPVLERLNDELLDPMIDRTFDILLQAGAIPTPPAALEGMDLKVEFTSIMAQAQKLVGVAGLDRFITTAMSMAQTFPGVIYKVDEMNALDDYADALVVNPRVVRTDEEARALLGQAQQAAAAQQQAEALKTTGQAAQSLANAPTQSGTSTALDDVIRGAQAQVA